MGIVTEYITFSTAGDAQMLDITSRVEAILRKGRLEAGIVTVSAIGSTAAITTCEFEPGLQRDVGEVLDKLIPPGRYHHDQTWGDGNGHAHLRASLIGPSVTLPFKDKALIVGTWQQIVFLDFDNRPRERRVVVQVVGE